MPNKRLPFLLILWLMTFNSCTQKCSNRERDLVSQEFKSQYVAWKESLNYMDVEVIESANQSLDSVFVSISRCGNIPDSFLTIADSISFIYKKEYLSESNNSIASQLLGELDNMVEEL